MGLKLDFHVECPHCGERCNMQYLIEYETEASIDVKCHACDGLFLVLYSLKVDTSVYRCDTDGSDVYSTCLIEWNEEDEKLDDFIDQQVEDEVEA